MKRDKGIFERKRAALEELLGERIEQAAIERIELDRTGRLVVTLETAHPSGSRWFTFPGAEPVEIFPHEDPPLPLCETLEAPLTNGSLYAWRPGRRITLAAGTASEGVLKGYRTRRSGIAAERFARANASCTQPTSFLTPRLVEHDVQLAALRMERLALPPFGVRPTSAEFFYRAGYALGRFQEEVDHEDLEHHSWAAELYLLKRLAERVTTVGLELPPGWRDSFEQLSAMEAPETQKQVAVHRDLHDGQLFESGTRVVLLDFDLLCAGDVALDAANLTAHLWLRSLQGMQGANDEWADACGRAFLEGLDPRRDHDFVRSLRSYQSSTFLRLALVYSLRPRWTALTPTMVKHARTCIDGLPLA